MHILVAQGQSMYLYHQLDSLHSFICWNIKWFKRSLKSYENPHFVKKRKKLFSKILLDSWENPSSQLRTKMMARGSCHCLASKASWENMEREVPQYHSIQWNWQQLHWRKCFSASGISQQPPVPLLRKPENLTMVEASVNKHQACNTKMPHINYTL